MGVAMGRWVRGCPLADGCRPLSVRPMRQPVCATIWSNMALRAARSSGVSSLAMCGCFPSEKVERCGGDEYRAVAVDDVRVLGEMLPCPGACPTWL